MHTGANVPRYWPIGYDFRPDWNPPSGRFSVPAPALIVSGMKPILLRRPATMVALASIPFGTSPARGSGFELSVHGVSGFAGAGATAEDASTVWWNPAGMSKLPPGEQLAGAVLYIRPSIKFSDGGSAAGVNRSDFGN